MDYKALQLLACKKDDDSFQLGGKGLDKQFCLYCTAIRVGTIHVCFYKADLHSTACRVCLQYTTSRKVLRLLQLLVGHSKTF